MTLGALRALPEDERDEMFAAYSLICSCGNLRSVCSDPDVDWHPQESVCWASATRQWGVRRLQEQHKGFDYEARDDRGEPLMSPLDGVSVWVSDVDLEALASKADNQNAKPHDA